MTRTPIVWFLPFALWACDGPTIPAEYRDVEVPLATLKSAEAQQEGRALYEQHCMLCHGKDADGQGVRHTDLSAHPPNFNTPAWRRTVNAKYVYATIRKGKRGTSMPSFRALPEDDVWKLVAYVLSRTWVEERD